MAALPAFGLFAGLAAAPAPQAHGEPAQQPADADAAAQQEQGQPHEGQEDAGDRSPKRQRTEPFSYEPKQLVDLRLTTKNGEIIGVRGAGDMSCSCASPSRLRRRGACTTI